ncbi:MAG: DNA-directed RNA polymerase subunit omega [Ignavibacteriales bacterium]|nr:DNA-directed RNA polymerase subunit omega [Ignavibacteriales bacterium]
MSIKTLEIKELEAKAANVYEAIVVLSKRARQINEETKIEFSQRIENLVALPGNPDEVEDVANPDQMRISLEFEKRPKATEEAIEELMNNQLEHRYKEAEVKK